MVVSKENAWNICAHQPWIDRPCHWLHQIQIPECYRLWTQLTYHKWAEFIICSTLELFSNYKNPVTGKALTGIPPHEMGLLFSDSYPGSITDSSLTEKAGVIQWVKPGQELMSGRGFAVQDLCSITGIYLNRPAHKPGGYLTKVWAGGCRPTLKPWPCLW